jgi:hypothetical protein
MVEVLTQEEFEELTPVQQEEYKNKLTYSLEEFEMEIINN